VQRIFRCALLRLAAVISMSQVFFRKFVRSLYCLAVALIVGGAMTPAHADVEEVLKKVQRDGSARVVVRMKADSGRAAWSARQPASSQRAAVAAAIEGIQPSLRRARIGAYKTFRTLPLVATTVTQDQLISLMGADNVESVSLVRTERKTDNIAGFERAQLATSVPSIDLGGAWAKNYDGTGYAVAVIDDGFNLKHPMLKGKNVGDACFGYGSGTTIKNNCPSGSSPEVGIGAASNCFAGRCNHGTHVASVAVGNDGLNFGVARGAKLVPIDVFSTYADPNDCSPDPAPCQLTDTLAVLDALDYVNDRAVDLKIAAVNLSIGGGLRDGYCDDDPRKSVIDMLRQKGVAVAIASGNGGVTGKITSPACISSALGVGATDDGTTVASLSNFASTLDFMAPGMGVLAASGTGAGLVSMGGTSVSAPHVAGAWAVMRQAFPTGQFDQIEQALKKTGVPVTRVGSGITVSKIQVAKAIDRLNGKDRLIFNNLVSSNAPALGVSFLRIFNNSNAVGTVTATMRDSTTGAVLGTWTSSSIPAQASPQIALKTIEINATPANNQPIASNDSIYYNLELTSTFPGYLQHVLLARAGIFANLSSCAGGFTEDSSVALNVHSSALLNYNSRLRIVNTSTVNDYAVLKIYNNDTGAEIAQWKSPDIAAGATLEITSLQLEAQVDALRPATINSLMQYNVRLANLNGYLQHLVENSAAGALLDMSSKCDLGAMSSAVVTK
jgi:subtilisin family serine protease